MADFAILNVKYTVNINIAHSFPGSVSIALFVTSTLGSSMFRFIVWRHDGVDNCFSEVRKL